MALSIILTLRLPQVLDKLDQIMRYSIEFVFMKFISVFVFNYPNLICTFCLCQSNLYAFASVCTSVMLGGSEDISEEESRYGL